MIGSAYVARNNAFILAHLMHNHIIIVENTRRLSFMSALNDDNTDVHLIANISIFILGTYAEIILFFIKTTTKNNNNNNNNNNNKNYNNNNRFERSSFRKYL